MLRRPRPISYARRVATRRHERARLGARALAVVVTVVAAFFARGALAAGPASEIQFRAAASADATELRIEVDVPAGFGARFTVDPEAIAFVEGVSRLEPGGWVTVARAGTGWDASPCARAGCRLRYAFHLAAAARALDDPDTVMARGGAFVGPASTWLLRPARVPDAGVRARLQVSVPAPLVFVTGLPRIAGAPDGYAVQLLPFFISPYAAFGTFDREELRVGGATLELAVARAALGADAPRLRAWVLAAARAVAAYLGRFPVDRALVLAVPQARGLHGKALGGGGASVLIQVAPGADLADPAVDWQAAHEMVHLAVPEMARAQLWLTEGLATYVEPLARSLTGELTPASVWRDMIAGLPKGLPAPGDRGLDRTHTWGRTYWGGALFAFVADVEIRKASGGAQSLATALRGALAAGADARVAWPVERFTAACDAALGKPIVTALYRQMADNPVAVPLAALWRELGVSMTAGHVETDDAAPLASIRRAMVGTIAQVTRAGSTTIVAPAQ